MRWILQLALLLLCTIVVGQGESNPFDIGTRNDIHKPQIDHPIESKNDNSHAEIINPFDIREIGKPKANSTATAPKSEQPKTISEQRDAEISTRKKLLLPNHKLLLALLLLSALALMVTGLNIDSSRFRLMLRSIISNGQLKALVRTGRQMTNPQNILFYLSFWITTSIFIYLLLLSYSVPFLQWWMAPVGLLLIYLVRHIVLSVFAFVYPLGAMVSVHNVSIGVHNMLLAIPLLIADMGILFGPQGMRHGFIYLGISAILIFYGIRQLKGTGLVVQMRSFNPIYFFIYLCAFEVAPFLILLGLIK